LLVDHPIRDLTAASPQELGAELLKTICVADLDLDGMARALSLIAHGADVTLKDQFDKTALLWAAHNGHGRIVEAIVQKGAALEVRDDWGTPLCWAAYKGDLLSVQSLLNAGANPNAREKEGRTALILSIDYEHDDATKALIDGKAALDAQTPAGATALLYAIDRDRPVSVKNLIDAGANVNLETERGTPFEHARWRDDKTALNLIIARQEQIRLAEHAAAQARTSFNTWKSGGCQTDTEFKPLKKFRMKAMLSC
jgi:ankyrin repeat protein